MFGKSRRRQIYQISPMPPRFLCQLNFRTLVLSSFLPSHTYSQPLICDSVSLKWYLRFLFGFMKFKSDISLWNKKIYFLIKEFQVHESSLRKCWGWGEMSYPDFIRNVFPHSTVTQTFVVAQIVKKLPEKPSLIRGSERPPGEGNGSVQSLSCVWLFVTTWTAASQASLSITSSRSVLELMSVELVMPFNHLIVCCPLFLLPSIIPSTRVISGESVDS